MTNRLLVLGAIAVAAFALGMIVAASVNGGTARRPTWLRVNDQQTLLFDRARLACRYDVVPMRKGAAWFFCRGFKGGASVLITRREVSVYNNLNLIYRVRR